MNVYQIANINKKNRNNLQELIALSEKKYADQLLNVALRVREDRREKPILLLSGPSGSGKTTSALRIQALLKQRGCESMVLSMDNYYLPETETPQAFNEHGVVDYESPYRLDIPLITEHLQLLAAGKEIEMPVFNFAKQCRERGSRICRKPDSLIILEGIHALNPDVTGHGDDFASCIYVSVRTRLQKKDGALLHPSRIRLMRRLMRDHLFRGRTPMETLTMFESVSAGEETYIMPYKHRATYEIDTLHAYEASVYQSILLPELKALAESGTLNEDSRHISDFLAELDPIPMEQVPGTSLIREFIGGSTLTY